MKRLRSIIVMLFFILISPTCLAVERYEYVGQNDDKMVYFDTLSLYHKPASKDIAEPPILIYADKGTMDFWVKFEYTEQGKKVISNQLNKDGISYSLSHWIIKTDMPEIKELGSIYYGEDGHIIEQYDTPLYQQKFMAIVPESIGEAVRKAVIEHKIKFYIELEELRKNYNDPNNPLREKHYFLTQDTNDFVWLNSDNEFDYFFSPKSIKWIQKSPCNIMEVLMKSTSNALDKQDNSSYILSHERINLDDQKIMVISFALVRINGEMPGFRFYPEWERKWTIPGKSYIVTIDKLKNKITNSSL